jgi:MoaA/NifB/PqqE/SkfB family radical SAM enzyme
MPFYSQENRPYEITPCCLLSGPLNIPKLQQEFLVGGRPAACQKCWSVENVGGLSRRMLNNQSILYRYNCTEEQIIEDCRQGKNKIILYQITTSNLCDQACVTCSSRLSTKWAEVEHRAGIKPKPFFQADLDAININYADAYRIGFVGGEPFFDPTTFKVLRRLIEHNNRDVAVTFTTNGGSKFNQQQLELVKQFKHVGIIVSIDGTGPVFEYMRWPGRWDQLVSNILDYQTISNVKVSYTVSSVNAWYYNQTMSWFEENNLEVGNLNPVYYPTWCSLNSMPAELKKIIKNQNNALAKFCEITGQEISIETFITQIKNQDQVRGTSIEESMPEFWAVLQSLR